MFPNFIQAIHNFFPTSNIWRTKKFIVLAGCFIFAILAVLFLFTRNYTGTVAKKYPDITNIPHVPDQLTVKFKTGQTPDLLKNIPEEFRVIKYKKIFPLENNELQNYYQLTFRKESDLNKINAYLKQRLEIEGDSIEVNSLMRYDGSNTPNDPLYDPQWALKTIDIENAWAITKGDKKIIVAVVDSGVDYNHEEFLGKNIITKGGDFNSEHGNATGKGGDPMDIIGHGTAVAGIIGASVNNQKGIAGVNWDVTILAVKAGGENENFPINDALTAISSSIAQGAKIINMSFAGDGSCSNSFQSLINNHKDIIFIAAAGNGSCQLPDGTYRERNTDGSCPTGGQIVAVDVKNTSPASCSGVIVVASINQQNQRAASSNWGTKVDLAAPGVKIITTRSANCPICTPVTNEQSKKYIEASGTSLSAPYVTGVAALLLAKYPQLSSEQVKSCLVKSGDVIAFDKPIGTRLNAARALKECPAILADSGTPPAVTPAPDATGTETNGKLICTPEGGIDKRFDSKILHIKNNTGKEVKISYQSFLCPYKGTALKEGDHCDDFKTGNVDTLSAGVTKTYTLDIPSCTIGQLDIRVANPSGIGCSQPNTGIPWDDGLGYVIQANSTGFSGSCGGNTVPNAASVRVTLDSSGSTEKTSGLHMSTFKPDN